MLNGMNNMGAMGATAAEMATQWINVLRGAIAPASQPPQQAPYQPPPQPQTNWVNVALISAAVVGAGYLAYKVIKRRRG